MNATLINPIIFLILYIPQLLAPNLIIGYNRKYTILRAIFRTIFRTGERFKMSTKIMPVSDLRRQTSAIIRTIQEEQTVVYITQHGRPAAVMLNYEAYELLLDQAQERGWPTGYFAQTYGALADDPISRPEQGDFEGREPLE